VIPSQIRSLLWNELIAGYQKNRLQGFWVLVPPWFRLRWREAAEESTRLPKRLGSHRVRKARVGMTSAAAFFRGRGRKRYFAQGWHEATT